MNPGYPIFGECPPGVPVQTRPGAYALILDAQGQLAVLRLSEGWYLPGGGQKNKECLEVCLAREVLEETGQTIELLWYLGQAGQYLPGRKRVLFKVGYFFLAEFQGPAISPPAPEHQLHWLPLPEAQEKLRHPYQAWAVTRLQAWIQA